MAVTAQKSVQLNNAEASPKVLNFASDVSGKLRIAYFNSVQVVAGDAASTVELVKLPPGRNRILGKLSRIAWSAFGASRVLDVGHRSYTKSDGTTEAESANVFDNDIDVSSAGNAAMGVALGEPETYVVTSKDGVTLFATVAGGTIPDGATLSGYVVYSRE